MLRSELVSAMDANREAADEQSLPQELLAAFSPLLAPGRPDEA